MMSFSKRFVMKFDVALSVLTIFILSDKLTHGVTIQTNQESIVTNVGESTTLICDSSPHKLRSCSFQLPSSKTIPVVNGAKYEKGRILGITSSGGSDDGSINQCGVEISSVVEGDNGAWTCVVTTVDPETFEAVVANNSIKLTVAASPEEVTLTTIEDSSLDAPVQRVLNDNTLELQLTDGAENAVQVECRAVQARPAPRFAWFIGNTLIDGTIENRIENVDEVSGNSMAKADFIQTLTYFPDPKHNGQPLKCEVSHVGFTESDIQAGVNVKQYFLELLFKPQSKPSEQAFYGLKVNGENNVSIDFEANPYPLSAAWIIASTEGEGGSGSTHDEHGEEQATRIEMGQDVDQYRALPVTKGELPGQHRAVLVIKSLSPKLSGKLNKLIVANEQGTTEYLFRLQLGDKPPAAAANSEGEVYIENNSQEHLTVGPVIGIVVAILVILLFIAFIIFARSRRLFCFTAKRSEAVTGSKSKQAAQSAPSSGGGNGVPHNLDSVEKGGLDNNGAVSKSNATSGGNNNV